MDLTLAEVHTFFELCSDYKVESAEIGSLKVRFSRAAFALPQKAPAGEQVPKQPESDLESVEESELFWSAK